MLDILVMLAIWWAPVLVIIGVLALLGKIEVSAPWLVASIAFYAIYVAAVFSRFHIPGFEAAFGETQYNWSGKLLAIATSAVMIIVTVRSSEKLTFADAGLTFRQREGSVGPALIAIALMIAFIIGLQMLANDGATLDTETLLYQATIPGIDEELMFRGLLLLGLSMAVTGRTWNLWGAPVGWAAILVTIIFALGHSIIVSDGQIQTIWIAMIYTAILGWALMWIRLRTGSILLPIIAHNATNFVGQFF
ncbi:type II CAAX prenyl endopeptidase Rce1 family protein [Parasphingorhabdus sp.]|uniref:CPBP family glutamic-type intramembrane protease n=1 Tax=Parasphingorhabdus sp. TaxID=2709688 RepID=UPI003A91AECE